MDAIGDYSINSSDSDENKFIDFIQEEVNLTSLKPGYIIILNP